MRIETTITENNYVIDIIGEYVPAERGSRDRFGVPLEPDYDAYFDVIDVKINGNSLDEYELADKLGYSVDYVCDMIQDELYKAYESELEYYHEIQAENQRESYANF